MKVVLLKDVPKLGKKYDVKDVADGFAYNNLIPRGLVAPATREHVQKAVAQVTARAEKEQGMQEAFRTLMARSVQEPVRFSAEANEKGHLFRAIRIADIIDALAMHHVSIKERDVLLPAPLKELGPHVVPIHYGTLKGQLHIIITRT